MFSIPKVVWQKVSLEVSDHLDFSSLLYLHESGTRISLVLSVQVCKVSYYLRRCGPRSPKGIALSQSYFASFIVLYTGKTAHVQTTCKMAFLVLFTLQVRAQSDANLEVTSCPLCGTLLRGRGSFIFYIYLPPNLAGEAKKYQSSPYLVSKNQFRLPLFVEPFTPDLLLLLAKRGGPPQIWNHHNFMFIWDDVSNRYIITVRGLN